MLKLKNVHTIRICVLCSWWSLFWNVIVLWFFSFFCASACNCCAYTPKIEWRPWTVQRCNQTFTVHSTFLWALRPRVPSSWMDGSTMLLGGQTKGNWSVGPWHVEDVPPDFTWAGRIRRPSVSVHTFHLHRPVVLVAVARRPSSLCVRGGVLWGKTVCFGVKVRDEHAGHYRTAGVWPVCRPGAPNQGIHPAKHHRVFGKL